MNAVLKMCRACNVEKPKIKFSGWSAKCCMCMYAKNKEFFTKYYIDNQARITAYEREKYHIAYDHIPKQKRGRKMRVVV